MDVGGLLWTLKVLPNAKLLSSGKAYVTVYDVLFTIYHHLHATITHAKYKAMTKSRQMEIFCKFKCHIGANTIKHKCGFQHVNLLNRHFYAEGLANAHLMGNIWNVVISKFMSSSKALASGPSIL